MRALRVAGLLTFLSPLLLACDGSDGGADAALTPPPPPEVTVASPLVRRLTEWDEFTGRFEPIQQVEIRARVSGYLQEIGFEDGDDVEPGQMLFVIDPRPYQATVDQVKAQIEQAQSRLTLAGLEQARAAQLVTTSAVAKATLDARDAELQAARASLASAQAQLRQAELNLGFTRVTAPFAGRASARRVDAGNLVDDETLLTTVVQLDPIYLGFDMSESDFLAYQREVARGQLASTRNRETVGASDRRARMAAQGHHELRRQHRRAGHRHDPGAGDVPERRGPDHAGPVRPRPHPRLARV
jgi:RND family efflux transporter MFP subunit